ncbi:flavin reductase family protein [Caenispirillum bisanense]|uniref:flavin reductase family protein n=1 Tax=Caenispirillum bisanense TaxID=414052 RepID=UPI0031E46E85
MTLPMRSQPFDTRDFRRALGQFATGVCIVTARDQAGHPTGLTVNSFASVSLEPPLVLWSLARSSSVFAAFDAAPHFAVNVLAADQLDLSNRFASPGERFTGLEWEEGHHGLPLLRGCLANFECTVAARHEGGDHIIFIGEVARYDARPGEPLLYSGGRYALATPHDGL